MTPVLCSVALGYDEGTAMIKIGREEPVASMDSSGKIIWAHHNEIQTVNVKSLSADTGDVSPVCCMRSSLPCLQILLCAVAGGHYILLHTRYSESAKRWLS